MRGKWRYCLHGVSKEKKTLFFLRWVLTCKTLLWTLHNAFAFPPNSIEEGGGIFVLAGTL